MTSYVTQSNVSKLRNAQIFVERPENNGSVNVVPCVIKLNTNQRIILSGGQTNLFPVKPGAYFLTASSGNLYEPSAAHWKSNQLKITVTNSQTIKIVIEPKSEGSFYAGGWILTSENP